MTLRHAASQREEATRYEEYAAAAAALKRKYLRASERPWGSIEPDPPPAHPILLGAYWYTHGNYSRSLAAYEDGSRFHPKHANSLSHLAWFLATCPDQSLRDGRRAFQLATRAIELDTQKNATNMRVFAAALCRVWRLESRGFGAARGNHASRSGRS